MSTSSPSRTAPKGDFSFDKENLARAKRIIARYPEGRQASAVLPLLDIAQRQSGGWLPPEAVNYVADFLGMPALRVFEVASFYSMFNLKPVGKNFIQICRTTPCWLRGSDDLVHVCQKKLGIDLGETTQDGHFTMVEVECLGGCVNAPVVQINDDYFEDVTSDHMEELLQQLARGEKPTVGSQIGRYGSAPEGYEAEKAKSKKKKG